MCRGGGIRQGDGDNLATGCVTPDFDGSITLQYDAILKQRLHQGRSLCLPSHAETHRP